MPLLVTLLTTTPVEPPYSAPYCVRLHLVFGHRVERDARLRALRSAAARIVVVLAVDQEQVVRRRLAVRAELAAFERSDLQHRDQARNRLHQAELASVRARQPVDLGAGHVGADAARGRFDERRWAVTVSVSATPGDLQRQVEGQIPGRRSSTTSVRRQDLKAGQLRLDGVGAWEQRRE